MGMILLFNMIITPLVVQSQIVETDYSTFVKMAENKELGEVLKSTGDASIVEDTTGWHDNLWGSCSCPRCDGITGQNLLGKALMEVRARLSE